MKRSSRASALRRVVELLALVGIAGAIAAGAQAQSCGDCDGNGEVTVSELITAVNISLGAQPLSTCPPADVDGVDGVRISDLIRAVARAIGGPCESGGTPTVDTTASVTPTPTQTVSPTPQLEGATLIQAASEVALENPQSFEVMDFGFVGAAPRRPRGGMRLARARPAALQQRLAAGGVDNSLCPDGGTAVVAPCTDGELRVDYAQCRSTTDSGHSVERNGRVVQRIDNPNFCTTRTVEPGDVVETILTDYRQEERDVDVQLALLTATATDRFAFTREGCLLADGSHASDGEQRLDGQFSLTCSPAAESVSCPSTGTDRALVARDLRLVRSSGGFPCQLGITASGELAVNDRVGGTDFNQRFTDFLIAESTPRDDPSTSLFTQFGETSVDCLGALNFRTKLTSAQVDGGGAITYPPGQACPVGGALEVNRPVMRDEPGGEGVAGAALQSVADGGGAGGAPIVREVRSKLFRASGGTVYQVLQNSGSDLDFGATAFRVTSLVGTAGGPLATCAVIAGELPQPTPSSGDPGDPGEFFVDPFALAGTSSNFALPLELVRKSVVIHDATTPCFNRNAFSRAGMLCIGPGCTRDPECDAAGSCDCSCVDGSLCQIFTFADGDPLSAGSEIPPAEIVASAGCARLTSTETYRFGMSGPTIAPRQCDTVPADGFDLPFSESELSGGTDGSTVVIAYQVSSTSLFNAGAAGFAIDRDGNSPICGGEPDVLLHVGRALADSSKAPVILYKPNGNVQFDFDGDSQVDRSIPSCAVSALRSCQ